MPLRFGGLEMRRHIWWSDAHDVLEEGIPDVVCAVEHVGDSLAGFHYFEHGYVEVPDVVHDADG